MPPVLMEVTKTEYLQDIFEKITPQHVVTLTDCSLVHL